MQWNLEDTTNLLVWAQAPYLGEKEKMLAKKKKIGEQSEPSSVVVPTTKLASLTVIFPTNVLHPFFLAFSPTTEPAWSQATNL